MTMGTDPDITGKNGPKFSIEFPPPIPDKENAKGQKPPVRSQKKKTEKISLPPAVGQNAAPRPIPVKSEKPASRQRLPVRSEGAKEEKISDPLADDGQPCDIGKQSIPEERVGDPLKKPSYALPWVAVLAVIAILALIIWAASSHENPQTSLNADSSIPIVKTDVEKQNPLAGGGIPSSTPTQQIVVERAIPPQPSLQTNAVSQATSNKQSEAVQQKQTLPSAEQQDSASAQNEAAKALGRLNSRKGVSAAHSETSSARSNSFPPIQLPPFESRGDNVKPLSPPSNIQASGAIRGHKASRTFNNDIPSPSFHKSDEVNKGGRKSSNDIQWEGSTYKVSPRDWSAINKKIMTFNAKNAYIVKLNAQMVYLEKQIESSASGIDKTRISNLQDSLFKEWMKKDAEQTTERYKIDNMVSHAAIYY
jgi:hypothetical protein